MNMEDKEELKIVFINKKGLNHDGNYEYELMYSRSPEMVWGEDFAEQVPSTCDIEDLLPLKDTYDLVRTGISPFNIKLAQENSCFSMQDCVDGIIALAWIYDEDNNRYYALPYGSSIEDADYFMEELKMEYVNEEVIEHEENKEETVEDTENEDKRIFMGEIEKEDDDNEEIEDEEDLEKLYNGEF
jgi:hypothetical protein